ncbi:hypothetical protein BOVMAS37_10390 [Streptococcus uberis]|uniref:helix-turn-helix transcriptional regulator n=1 Tax=Streptococcus uberis TaxID=1349 RepID=UPI0038D47794
MNRLKELRQKNGLTQQELADVAKVTKRSYIYWENNERQLKPEKARILAEYFDVSVAYLLGYSDKKQETDYEAVERMILNSNLPNEKIVEYGKEAFQGLVGTEVLQNFENEWLEKFKERSKTDSSFSDFESWQKKWLKEFYESFEKATPPIRLILARYFSIPKVKREAVDLLLELQSLPYIEDNGDLIDKIRGH